MEFETLVDIKSEANMDPESNEDVCICCFNKSKDFVKLSNCKHRTFFDHVVVKDIKLMNFSICSLCHAFLLKIEAFKQQIIVNLDMMMDPLQVIDITKIPQRLKQGKTVTASFAPTVTLAIISSVKSNVNAKDVGKPQVPHSSLRIVSSKREGLVNCSPVILTNTGQLLRLGNRQNQPNNIANTITSPKLLTSDITGNDTDKSKVGIILVPSLAEKSISQLGPIVVDADNKKPVHVLTDGGQLLPVLKTRRNRKASTNKNDGVDKDDSATDSDEGDWNILNNRLKMEANKTRDSNLFKEVPVEFEGYNSKLETACMIRYFGKIASTTLTEEGVTAERDVFRQREEYQLLPFKCEDCLVSYKYDYTLNDHIARRHKPKAGLEKFTCGICKCVMKNSHGFGRHMDRHLRRYTCLSCQQRFEQLKFAIAHYGEAHSAEYDKERGCTKCKYKSKTHSEYLKHKLTHLQYKCKECPKKFDTKTDRQAHFLSVHRIGGFPCKECPKVFGTAGRMYSHAWGTHQRELDTAYCTPCGKLFKNKYCLRAHIRTHSAHVGDGDRRFECHDCGRRFLSKREVCGHIRFFHLNNSPFKCKLCGKVCINNNTLKTHISHVHEKKRLPKNKICQYCGRGFSSSSQLTNHTRTHTGERPLQCDLCPATFAHGAARYNHRRIVHKVPKLSEKK